MQDIKTVYYIGNFDKPEQNAAGKRVYGNALIFEKLGYKVILIGKSKDEQCKISPDKYGKSIFFYSFPDCSVVRVFTYIKYLSNLINREGEPCMIVRYGSPGLAIFDYALLKFCKKHKYPVVADVVDWLSSNGNNLFFDIIKTMDTFLEKAIFNRKSDGVITIGTYLANYYKTHGCRNVLIIPPIAEKYKGDFRIPSAETVNIVYAGIPFRLGKRIKSPDEVKDRLDLAVLALAGVNESVVFNIYGLTQKEYLTAYPDHDSIIKKKSDCFLFHGKKSMETVQNAVNQGDLTILLRNKKRSTNAGFPTKVVESLTCGTPVITTDTSDLRKYILPGRNGFIVKIDDLQGLQIQLDNAIRYYKQHRKEMRENCITDEHFMPDRYTELLRDFLKKIRDTT